MQIYTNLVFGPVLLGQTDVDEDLPQLVLGVLRGNLGEVLMLGVLKDDIPMRK